MRVCGRLADAGIDLETFPDASLDKLIAAETTHVLAGTPSPTAAALPTAPRAESPRLPAGVFRAPRGSRIRTDGMIITPDGKSYSACDSNGNRLHVGGKAEKDAPDWVFCKA